jgi:hypothetical protein
MIGGPWLRRIGLTPGNLELMFKRENLNFFKY